MLLKDKENTKGKWVEGSYHEGWVEGSLFEHIKKNDRLVDGEDLPIIKIHENIKNHNRDIYNSNLKIVKDYIEGKKNIEYKRYLLLRETGFDFFDNKFFLDRDYYLKAKKIVRLFDYYKKKYPDLQFIYEIPPIIDYHIKDVSSYSNIIPYDDLVILNNNINKIDYEDYKIELYILRSDGQYIILNKTIGNRINILNILKRNKINYNFNSFLYSNIRLTSDNFNKKELLFIDKKFQFLDKKLNNFHNYPLTYDYSITNNSINICLSNKNNFNSEKGVSENNNETIFFKSVRGGYLITSITGDNGSISLNRFKELIGFESIKNDDNIMYNNDYYS